jgi:hypothetical protein
VSISITVPPARVESRRNRPVGGGQLTVGGGQ